MSTPTVRELVEMQSELLILCDDGDLAKAFVFKVPWEAGEYGELDLHAKGWLEAIGDWFDPEKTVIRIGWLRDLKQCS